MKLLVKQADSKTIAARIIARRIYLGLTQQRLAEMLEISTQAVSRYERGLSIPGAASLVALADSLQCPVDFLLGRIDTTELMFSDLDTLERKLVTTFREKQEKLVTTTLNQQLNKIAQPTRDHIIRLVKFFLKNPGQVDDITDDS